MSANVRFPGGGSLNAGTSTGRLASFTCEVENLNSLRFCDQSLYDMPLQTNFKMSGSYSAALRAAAERDVSEPARRRAGHHLPGDSCAAADADGGVGERAAERTGHRVPSARSTRSISACPRASSTGIWTSGRR